MSLITGAEAQPRPTILISDSGQDQAAAIFATLAAPEVFDVRAVIAVAGNIGTDHSVDGMRMLLELAGRPDIPLHVGNGKPLAGNLVTATHVHGPTGIDGWDFPPPTMPVQELDGANAIIRLLRDAEDGEFTILCTSPATTLATALLQDPTITRGVREVFWFGGAFFEGGNITPAAEFNVFVDPHAAHILLISGMTITALSLDASHKVLSTPARLQAFRDTGTTCGEAIAALLSYSEAFDLAKYGGEGAPLHGPLVPIAAISPELVRGRFVSVRVELDDGPAFGATSVDWWSVTDEEPNATYVADVDADAYYDLLTTLYGRLP